jgi:hypothetical protein
VAARFDGHPCTYSASTCLKSGPQRCAALNRGRSRFEPQPDAARRPGASPTPEGHPEGERRPIGRWKLSKQSGKAGPTGTPLTGHVYMMIGGWHWRGRTGLAADWRILLPPPGGEATLLKTAANCDDRGMTTRRFPAPWRAELSPTAGLTFIALKTACGFVWGTPYWRRVR